MASVFTLRVGGATWISLPAGSNPLLLAPYSTSLSVPVSSMYPYLPYTSPSGYFVSILKVPSAASYP